MQYCNIVNQLCSYDAFSGIKHTANQIWPTQKTVSEHEI
jgi:hypothetical protein